MTVLACVGLIACGAATPGPSTTPPAVSTTPDVRPDSAAPAVVLPAADCRALRAGRALGVAVVVESRPDCSGIGHLRVVLEVRRLARGTGIERIVTSRPLYGSREPRLEVGATVIAAIEPEVRPAETVYCVALPARQGSVRHAMQVDSLEAAEPILEVLASDRPCE
jgi:hypothetical protein